MNAKLEKDKVVALDLLCIQFFPAPRAQQHKCEEVNASEAAYAHSAHRAHSLTNTVSKEGCRLGDVLCLTMRAIDVTHNNS